MDDTYLRDLSDRERRVLRELALASPSKLIAQRLGICEASVRLHFKALSRKFGVTDLQQAIAWGLSVPGMHFIISASERLLTAA